MLLTQCLAKNSNHSMKSFIPYQLNHVILVLVSIHYSRSVVESIRVLFQMMDVHDVGDCQPVDSWDMEIRNTFLPQKTVDVISMWEVTQSLKTWYVDMFEDVENAQCFERFCSLHL